MTVYIGLSGWARSGKDTVADYLVEQHGFTRVAFADPMREALLALDPYIPIWGGSMKLSTLVKISGWDKLKENSPEVRELLQRMGTEVGRELFHPNFWVDQAMKKAGQYDKVVFSDCRYLNEANAIKNLNGKVWRISRPGVFAANSHGSEHDLDNYNFDLNIENKTDIKTLQKIIDVNLKLLWMTKN
jgi:dephospho-CoA kinase